MSDRIDEDLKPLAPTPEQPQDDAIVDELTQESQAEVTQQQVELEILTDQVNAIYQNPQAAQTLKPIDDDEKPAHYLHYPERIFAESYCRPSHVFVPKRGKAATLPELATFYRYVPLSPELFQESVLEKVYGEDSYRERQAHFYQLRRLFAKLTSLPHQNKYQRGRNQIKRIFVVPLKEARGKLLITRMAPDRRINSVFHDIYSAYRGHSHIVNNYDGKISEDDIEEMGEFKALLNLTDKLQLLIAFIQRWKKSSKQERTNMEQLLIEAEDLLANSQNTLKASAHKGAASSLEFTDSRGQVNPCATAPKLLKMGKELFARLDQILSIRAKITQDKGTLDKIIHPIHATFFNGTLELGNILQGDYFEAMDPEDNESTKNVKYKCAKVNKELTKNGGTLYKLEGMANDKHMPAPFVQYAMATSSCFKVAQMLNEYIEASRTGMNPYRLRAIHDEVCRYAIIGFIAMKYQFIHRTYHEILTRILEEPEKVDYDQERTTLNALSVRLRPHEFKKEFDLREDLEIDLPGFDGLFEHLQLVALKITDYKRQRLALESQLTPLEIEAEEGNASELLIDEIFTLKAALNTLTIDFRDEIRTIMKDFDFEELVKEATIDDPGALAKALIEQIS